jgi:hypothetical protein
MPTPVGVVDKSKRTARDGRFSFAHMLPYQILDQALHIAHGFKVFKDCNIIRV